MNKEIPISHKHESPLPKERWGVSFSVVTISGLPGCGNTVLAQNLAEKYGVKLVNIGQLLRESVEEPNLPIIDYNKRPVKVDEELDELQAKTIKRSVLIISNPTIIEAKLAGVIATEVLRTIPPEQQALSPVLRILVVADEDIRAERIKKREIEKHPDLEITQEEIIDKTRNRWRRDLTRYRSLHDVLTDVVDPWDSENKNNFYDFVIDTSNLTPEETVEKVHEYLQEQGLVSLY